MKCNDQHGFTFIELIIASLLSSILIGVLFVLLIQARRLTEFSVRAVTFNREAREAFSLLGNGFVADNKRHVGFAGCFFDKKDLQDNSDKIKSWSLKDSKKMNFERSEEKPSDNLFTVFSDKTRQFQATTTLSGVEYENKFLGWFYTIKETEGGQQDTLTRGVTLQLMDPSWIRDNPSLYPPESRNTPTFRAEPSEIRESYRTAFYLPVDQELAELP